MGKTYISKCGMVLLALGMIIIVGIGARPRPAARPPNKPPEGPKIEVVGDQDEMEDYGEDDDDVPGDKDIPKGPANAAPVRQHWVSIKCDHPQWVKGLALRVICFDEDVKLMRLCSNSVKFDENGGCKIELPEGQYQFEVLGGQDDAVIALRSVPRIVKAPTEVTLKTAELKQITLEDEAGKELPFRELGVRSASSSGEVRWQASDGDKQERIKLVVSPEQAYHVRAIAVDDQKTYAIWKPLNAGTSKLEITKGSLGRSQFKWAAAAKLAKGAVTVIFPDSKVEISLDPQAVLMSNRRLVTASYWMQSESGRKVVFHPKGYLLPPPGGNATFELGGPLKLYASQHVVIDKRPQHIYRIASWSELRDPAGHFVNLKDSQIGFKAQLRRRGGGEVGDGELHGNAAALHELGDELEVVASYEIDKLMTITQAVKPWVAHKSEHFNTESPEGWDWPTECYLLRSERIWRAIHEVTARTRKRDINLSWHGSRVSLGGTFGMAMPISGLHDAFDPYHYPQPIVHEMLHAFGYPHGEEMRYRHGLALKRLRAFRWYVAEHPEYVGG